MPAPDVVERVRIEKAALELDWVVDRHTGETWISRDDYRFVVIWSADGVAVDATLLCGGLISALKTWGQDREGVGRWVLRELHVLSPTRPVSGETRYPAAVPVGIAEQVIALAERLESYESSALIGPAWIAHQLRQIVREAS